MNSRLASTVAIRNAFMLQSDSCNIVAFPGNIYHAVTHLWLQVIQHPFLTGEVSNCKFPHLDLLGAAKPAPSIPAPQPKLDGKATPRPKLKYTLGLMISL